MSFFLFDSYIRLIISIIILLTFLLMYNNYYFIGIGLGYNILFFIIELYIIDDVVFKFLYFYEEVEKYLHFNENHNFID